MCNLIMANLKIMGRETVSVQQRQRGDTSAEVSWFCHFQQLPTHKSCLPLDYINMCLSYMTAHLCNGDIRMCGCCGCFKLLWICKPCLKIQKSVSGVWWGNKRMASLSAQQANERRQKQHNSTPWCRASLQNWEDRSLLLVLTWRSSELKKLMCFFQV